MIIHTRTPQDRVPGGIELRAATLVSLELSFKNNLRLDSGFYPGSGTQDGAAIPGRM
ncbi:MAG TPA: hypothetical protein VNJ11_08160 [Bryobacteraceae bacterium]|nr:hypothetical protein [Bryobacteraceae bacterium]